MTARPAPRSRTPSGRAATAPRARTHGRSRGTPGAATPGPTGPPSDDRRQRAPVDRARLTGRATVLFVVLVMLAVAYAWPLREYLSQRAELSRLRADSAATQAKVEALERQRQRWADPAYVRAQARDRLHFVLPGETGYVTLPTSRVGAPRTLPPATPPTPRAWYDVLWATVRAADDPATH